MSAPLKDSSGKFIGVIAAHLTWPWAAALDSHGTAQSLILNDAGMVAVGPAWLRDTVWKGVHIEETPPESDSAHFERLPGKDIVLVLRAPLKIMGAANPRGWSVQLSEPREFVYQRANALAVRIWWISICLGAATALLGALGARHLTNRLKNLTRSAAAVGRNEAERIEVPSGRDEVAQLAAAFAKVLDAFHQERGELLSLSSELERRVAPRYRAGGPLSQGIPYFALLRGP